MRPFRSFVPTALAAALVIGGVAMVDAGAAAQTPNFRIRGKITAVAGDAVSIATREGPTVVVLLAPDARVVTTVGASVADIKPNSFIGTAAVPQADGTLEALEVHIFPEAMRGAGEGSRDFDLAPGSTMTNATVSGAVSVGTGGATGGPTFRLTYKGGEKTVVVPPGVPVVTFAPGSRADVKPGVGAIIFGAEPGDDGTFKAGRITVGKDGVDPPM